MLLQVNRLIVCRPSHAKRGCSHASGSSETRVSHPSRRRHADVPAVDLTIGGDGGARDTGSEDKQAGELGKPFTETEDDEEWVGWIDWDSV